MRSYAGCYIEGKEYSQDALIPIAVLLIGSNDGRAIKKYVEENIYDLFRQEFEKALYQSKRPEIALVVFSQRQFLRLLIVVVNR